jgi:flagellar biosynthesis/type III secretory pathway chaperone
MSSLQEGIESLERLLDVERHAIRAGAFAELADIIGRKEALIGTLGGVGAGRLAHLRGKAEQNQRLLAAALKGVRAAQRRLDMILRASRSLNSYDALGRARTIGSGGPSVERRA